MFIPTISSTCRLSIFFFFNDTATTEIYTLSLHDALPISRCRRPRSRPRRCARSVPCPARSEEHTSELQSRVDIVCRLLLEKKKTRPNSRCLDRPPEGQRQIQHHRH